jgi:hypothetical protein
VGRRRGKDGIVVNTVDILGRLLDPATYFERI